MNSIQKPIIYEDWLSLCNGLFVFILSLWLFANVDILGWEIKTIVRRKFSSSTSAVSKTYEKLPGIASRLFAYVFLFFVVGAEVKAGTDFKNFFLPFTTNFSTNNSTKSIQLKNKEN